MYIDGDQKQELSATFLSNKTKAWQITVPRYSRVEMSFQKVDLETCDHCSCGSADVRDGSDFHSTLIGRYCGHTTPGIVRSTGRHLWVEFKSGYQGGRFEATCRERRSMHKNNLVNKYLDRTLAPPTKG